MTWRSILNVLLLSKTKKLLCNRSSCHTSRAPAMGPRVGVPSFRGGAVGGVLSKSRVVLRRSVVVKLLRLKSGRRLKKRARVVGGPTVVTVRSVPVRDAGDTRDTDDDDDAKSVSSDASDSSDVVIVDERPARPSPDDDARGAGARRKRDLVTAASSALDLRLRSEHGMGNCMFCAFSSGVNTWLGSKGTAGSVADAALFPQTAAADTGTHGVHGSKSSSKSNTSNRTHEKKTITWAHLRANLVTGLRLLVRDAPALAVASLHGNETSSKQTKKKKKLAMEIAMSCLMEGKEGREWLTRGALKNVDVATRFEKYVSAMASDAAPFAGTHTWVQYWGADNEIVVLASRLRVAVVCVETATQTQGFFLGVPADVAEVVGNKNVFENEEHEKRKNLTRPGRYMPGGALEFGTGGGDVSVGKETGGTRTRGVLRWRAARGKVTLTVRLVKTDSKAAAAAAESTLVSKKNNGEKKPLVLPALIVVHRPGHFDSLQPKEGYVLVMERTEVGGERDEGKRVSL